jgi:hypothetical protein
MTIHQPICMSEPFGLDDGVLNGILSISRCNNARDGITGALVCRRNIYLKLLEGSKDLVKTAFAWIAGDDRHLALHRLLSGEMSARLFPDWAMRDDPAQSWLWSEAEVGAEAVQAASSRDLQGVFERVAREIG